MTVQASDVAACIWQSHEPHWTSDEKKEALTFSQYAIPVWCWSWSSSNLATWCEEPTHWKRPWCWERLRAGEGDSREWDGWMASPTQWTWVWVTPGVGDGQVLQTMGSQRVGHNLATGKRQQSSKMFPLSISFGKHCIGPQMMLINSIFLENAIEDFIQLLSETFLRIFFWYGPF